MITSSLRSIQKVYCSSSRRVPLMVQLVYNTMWCSCSQESLLLLLAERNSCIQRVLAPRVATASAISYTKLRAALRSTCGCETIISTNRCWTSYCINSPRRGISNKPYFYREFTDISVQVNLRAKLTAFSKARSSCVSNTRSLCVSCFVTRDAAKYIAEQK